jgi:hypothetical protein
LHLALLHCEVRCGPAIGLDISLVRTQLVGWDKTAEHDYNE